MFNKINKYCPWLKYAIPVVVALTAYAVIKGLFINQTGEEELVIPRISLEKHVKVPENIFRRSIEGKKLVALTFDDGPEVSTTGRLLDILMEKDTPATFFQLGSKMAKNPELAQRASSEGHEVGSHTMYHQNLIRVRREAAEADINEAKQVYRDVFGKEVGIIRMPYGNSNAFIEGVAGTPLIYWTVDTRDWEVLDSSLVVENATSAAFDGAIILMHDIYNTTVDAVPEIIDGLREQGYEFVTVSELAKNRGVSMENGVTYYSFKP